MRNQRDEPTHAAIADAGDTSAGDEKEHINAVIVALEQKGVIPV